MISQRDRERRADPTSIVTLPFELRFNKFADTHGSKVNLDTSGDSLLLPGSSSGESW